MRDGDRPLRVRDVTRTVSTGRSVTGRRAMFADSRTNWAADQVSGEALPAALPFWKPIEAHSGAVPYGDGGQVGVLPRLFGDEPDPGRHVGHDAQQAGGRRPVAGRDSCSARSPASTGHRWPEPLFWPWCADAAHGLPWTSSGRVGDVAVAVAVLRAGGGGAVAVEAVPVRCRLRITLSTTASERGDVGVVGPQHAEAGQLEEALVDDLALVGVGPPLPRL